MITFETQEEFEDAVMEVVRKRLTIESRTESDYGYGGDMVKYENIFLLDYGADYYNRQFSSTSIG